MGVEQEQVAESRQSVCATTQSGSHFGCGFFALGHSKIHHIVIALCVELCISLARVADLII